MNISPKSNVDRPLLEPTIERQSLDAAQQAEAGLQSSEWAQEPQDRAPAFDAGEAVLATDVWEGVPAGQRMLAGDSALEGRLASLPLSGAVLVATDAVLTALA